MLKKLLFFVFLLVPLTMAAEDNDTVKFKLFDAVTFYDGYLYSKNPDSLVNDGVLRHSTSLYAVPLNDSILNNIGDSVWLKVYVQACCDNYDRIGNINLAFVPKGSTTYIADSVSRIELGRFITPFMDKNKKPDTVPYAYRVDYLSQILRDDSIRSKYDLWMEFELFGVPYAANQEITGCAGRSDVFKGTLILETSKPARPLIGTDVLIPIAMKHLADRQNNLNNYNVNATDTIGKTTKTWTFTVPRDVTDAQFVVVTSNHGANSGGEEYNRRWHYIYYDGDLVLSYRPGRKSCEPFRQYNTQANGIYGRGKRSDWVWQSFSNWCPGDVIDNRIISLGAVSAGTHTIRISVPDAQFVGQQGDIPVSIFFQGLTEGSLPTGITPLRADGTPVPSKPEVDMKVSGSHITLTSTHKIYDVSVYDVNGKRLHSQEGTRPIDISSLPHGVYLVNAEMDNGFVEVHKILK